MAAFLKFIHRNRQVFVGLGLAGLCSASLYPQTLGLNMYKMVKAEHKDGEQQPISPYLQELSQQVLDRIQLTPEQEVGIEFFSAYGNDMLHKGSINLRTGAVIGLPTTYNYTSVEQVEKDKMCIDQRSINWDSAAGQQLLNALILSENAKKFAIAREIHYTTMQHIWADGSLRTLIAFSAYATGYAMNNLLQLQTRMKRWGRVGLYGVIGSFYFVMYLSLSDAYFCSRDRKADRKAATMSNDYLDGGIEFYDKLLKRNMALRQLMGAEGMNQFTLYGNEVNRFWQKHVQLTARKDGLVKLSESQSSISPKLKEEECLHCK